MLTNKPWLLGARRLRTPLGERTLVPVPTGDLVVTARSAVLAVEATLRAEPLGATTVTRAFGAELSFEAGGELVAQA